MKRITFTIATVLVAVGLNVCQAQIKVANGGNVGIGIGSETPVYKLQVNGSTKVGSSLEVGGESKFWSSLEVNGNTTFRGSLTAEGGINTPQSMDFTGFKTEYTQSNIFSNGLWHGVQMSRLITPEGVRGIIGSYKKPIWEMYLINMHTRLGNPVTGVTFPPINDDVVHDRQLLENAKNRLANLHVLEGVLGEGAFSDIEDAEIGEVCMSQGLNSPIAVLLPEEIMEHFPQLVSHNEETDLYTVDYASFVPYLI